MTEVKKHLRRRCEDCGIVFNVWREGDGFYDPRFGEGENTVSWGPDPFQLDINGDDTCLWQCVDCSYNSMMEI